MRTIGHWLRAIGDCGTVRVRFDDDALIAAMEIGLVETAPVDGDEDALDFRLTAAGECAKSSQFTAVALS